MEQKPSHDASNLIFKTFVVEEDVSPRDELRQRDKKQMPQLTTRVVVTTSTASPDATSITPAGSSLSSSLDDRHPHPPRDHDHTDDASLYSDPHSLNPPRTSAANAHEDAITPHPPLSSRSAVPKLQLSCPRTTVLDLLTDSATPSALPQTLGFHISRNGRQIAVYNSTHIHLLDTAALPRAFVRTLEVKRRPVALDMLDDGSMLLLLDTPTMLNVYMLNAGASGDGVEKKCSIDLQHEARMVTLSADGLVAATGNQFGVELIALQTNAKRVVQMDRMDAVGFSDNGRTLLATNKIRTYGVTTTISVAEPFDGPLSFDGVPEPLEVDRAWTSQILFPEKAKTCRHAILLPEASTGQGSAMFAYDMQDATWGVYDLEACAFVSTMEFLPDLASRTKVEAVESALPAVSPSGKHVAIAVKQHGYPEIWVYKLPGCYEEEPDLDPGEDKDADLRPCLQIPLPRDESLMSQDIASLRWLNIPHEPSVERLVIVGSTTRLSSQDDPMLQVPQSTASSGVIIVMDFEVAFNPPQVDPSPQKIVFDLDGLLPGEKLPEDEIVFEREVELMRRRTVAQRDAVNRAALRQTATAHPPSSPVIRSPSSRPRPPPPLVDMTVPIPPIPDEETLNPEEAAASLEVPYAHAQPRSQASLHRAATVAASSSAARRHLRALPDRPLEYRRADGMREIPHESDADNWVPPPPPYTRTPGPSDAGIVASTPAQAPTVPPVPEIVRPQTTAPRTPARLTRRPVPTTPVSAPAVRPTSPHTPSPLIPPLSAPAPSTLQSSATFPRINPQQPPHPAVNLIPNPSRSGLRRSSNTFPTRISSRPVLQLQTSSLTVARSERNSARPSLRAATPGGTMDSREDTSAYNEAARSASALGLLSAQPLPPPPPPPKPEKRGFRCVIM